jgi:hypothetical protein
MPPNGWIFYACMATAMWVLFVGEPPTRWWQLLLSSLLMLVGVVVAVSGEQRETGRSVFLSWFFSKTLFSVMKYKERNCYCVFSEIEEDDVGTFFISFWTFNDPQELFTGRTILEIKGFLTVSEAQAERDRQAVAATLKIAGLQVFRKAGYSSVHPDTGEAIWVSRSECCEGGVWA